MGEPGEVKRRFVNLVMALLVSTLIAPMLDLRPDRGTIDVPTQSLVHRTKQMVHRLFGASRCTAHKLVGRLVQTDELSVWVGPLEDALDAIPAAAAPAPAGSGEPAGSGG